MQGRWYLVSSHGAILFYIAANPDCTIITIADDMALTQRTVWGIIGDLRRDNMLIMRREGRKHHYTVNLEAEFKHPTIAGIPLSIVLNGLMKIRTAQR